MRAETVIVNLQGRIAITVNNVIGESFQDIDVFTGEVYRDLPTVTPQVQTQPGTAVLTNQDSNFVGQRDDYNHEQPRIPTPKRTKYILNRIGAIRWFWQDLILGTDRGTVGVGVDFAFSTPGYLDVYDDSDGFWKTIALIVPGSGAGSDADPAFSFIDAGYLSVLDPRDSTTKNIPLIYTGTSGGTIVVPRFQWNTDGYLDVLDESDSTWKTIPLIVP